MAVGPCSMFSLWGPGRIEQTRLGQQNKGTIREMPTSNCMLGGGDLLKTSPEVQGGGARTIRCFPRNWRVQSIVHFKYTGPVAVCLQAMLVMIRKPFFGEFEKLSWGHVTERQVITWQS